MTLVAFGFGISPGSGGGGPPVQVLVGEAVTFNIVEDIIKATVTQELATILIQSDTEEQVLAPVTVETASGKVTEDTINSKITD